METIATQQAPAAIGPYAQAVRAGNLIFCSGQLGIDPATGALAEGVAAQTRQALTNLEAVLGAAGASLRQVAKTTLFLADLSDFQTVNTAYAEAFGDHKPARATIAAARLPLDGRIEIECVAVAEG